jgi:hypothetical protein
LQSLVIVSQEQVWSARPTELILMRIIILITLAIAAISASLHANAEPKRRFNMLVFNNFGPDNTRFEIEQDFASCARPVGPENLTVRPGRSEERRYYEKLSEDDCFYETKELRWLVTASRPEDNFRWQCRMHLINRIQPETDWFRLKVGIEPVEPVTPGTADLCTDGTLFKSAICEDADKTRIGQSNCLNQYVDMHGRITIELGGPPASWSVNPLTTSASQ